MYTNIKIVITVRGKTDFFKFQFSPLLKIVKGYKYNWFPFIWSLAFSFWVITVGIIGKTHIKRYEKVNDLNDITQGKLNPKDLQKSFRDKLLRDVLEYDQNRANLKCTICSKYS